MRMAAHNIIFAKAGGACFYESLLQGSSLVFQLNICAKNPRLRKYENRCGAISKKRIITFRALGCDRNPSGDTAFSGAPKSGIAPLGWDCDGAATPLL